MEMLAWRALEATGNSLDGSRVGRESFLLEMHVDIQSVASLAAEFSIWSHSCNALNKERSDFNMATSAITAHLDLVCGMPLDPSRATVSSEHNGNRHRFCRCGCKAVFDKNPDRFVTLERMTTVADSRCGRQG